MRGAAWRTCAIRSTARRAADEIPNAELLVLKDADHYAAHLTQDQVVLDAVLRTLRANS